MRPRHALCAVVGIATVAFVTQAQAQEDVSISIAKHAEFIAEGLVIVRVHVACDPLPGVQDFQETFAGLTQARTGAAAEGGLDGSVVCDGTARTHTATFSSFTDDPFRRGPATANAAVRVCHTVGDHQVCQEGAATRRIVIRGRLVP